MAWSDEVIILYSWRPRGHPGTYWEWSGHQIHHRTKEHTQCEDLGSNVFSRQNTTSAHNTETGEGKAVGSSWYGSVLSS